MKRESTADSREDGVREGLREQPVDLHSVDLGGHDEIAFGEAVDLVSP